MGVHDPGKPVRGRLAERPDDAVGKFPRTPGHHLGRRHPEGHDVVPVLAARRQLEQPHGALAPITTGLDPRGRTLFIVRLEVLVAGNPAVALHQAETDEPLHGRIRKLGRIRIMQGPPGAAAHDVLHDEAVGVVHFRPHLPRRPGGIFPVPEHAREGRHARERHRPAENQLRPDIHHRRLAGPHHELVGAGYARPLQQRINGERHLARGGLAHPEIGETRKLLRLVRQPTVHGQTAGRQPVNHLRPDRPEITRAQERDHLVVIVGPVERRMHPEPGVAERRVQIAQVLGQVIAEELPFKGDHLLVRRAEFPDGDLVAKHPAAMKELQLKRQPVAPPQRLGGPEPDVAILVVGQCGQAGRQIIGRSPVGCGGICLRENPHVIEVHRHGLDRRPCPRRQAEQPGQLHYPPSGLQVSHGRRT